MINNKGYTLIEMLIIMLIVAVITTVVLVDYRGGEKKYQLQLAAQEIMTTLRRSQEMALSAQEYKGQVVDSFGVNFNTVSPQSYTVFADVDGDERYDGVSEFIETITLPNEIEIYSLTRSPLNIVFSLPEAEVSITDNLAIANIGLRIINTTETKIVTINTAGVIEY